MQRCPGHWGVSSKTVGKWRDRFVAEGEAGLVDRSSRPHHSPTRLSGAEEAAIIALRRRRLSGPGIARELGRPVSTVGAVLRRHGLGRLSALNPRPPVVRYQRERPGELIHIEAGSEVSIVNYRRHPLLRCRVDGFWRAQP